MAKSADECAHIALCKTQDLTPMRVTPMRVSNSASPDISRYRVETRTALPFEGPFIEVSKLDERAGNAEAKLYRRSRSGDD